MYIARERNENSVVNYNPVYLTEKKNILWEK